MGPGKILLARSHCLGLVKRMGSDGLKSASRVECDCKTRPGTGIYLA
ncbi:MAG TPA: hypothetical protein PKH78_08330 [Candidatus Obscuribacter sp.]|nr:hypothetical protein [Candidatus Obscuribacter sp.]HNN63033.1 hypothetical protein [Candidatus Obscuribacter sp.]